MIKYPYKLFRWLAFFCLVTIVIVSALYYFHIVDDQPFAITSGVVAILAAIFGIFASKPIDKDDVSVAIDKVLLTYDTDTLAKLQKAKEEEEQEILDFIENRSNQIFLLKLRNYLKEEVEKKYATSEIAKLIQELETVERQLDNLQIQYGTLELPDRFKRLVSELNSQERENLYLDIIYTIVESIPLFPFKSLQKGILRLYYEYRLHRVR